MQAYLPYCPVVGGTVKQLLEVLESKKLSQFTWFSIEVLVSVQIQLHRTSFRIFLQTRIIVDGAQIHAVHDIVLTAIFEKFKTFKTFHDATGSRQTA